MIMLRESGDDVVENSIFEVWKEQDKSQLLILSANRSNYLFNSAESAVELPTTDLTAPSLVRKVHVSSM